LGRPPNDPADYFRLEPIATANDAREREVEWSGSEALAEGMHYVGSGVNQALMRPMAWSGRFPMGTSAMIIASASLWE